MVFLVSALIGLGCAVAWRIAGRRSSGARHSPLNTDTRARGRPLAAGSGGPGGPGGTGPRSRRGLSPPHNTEPEERRSAATLLLPARAAPPGRRLDSGAQAWRGIEYMSLALVATNRGPFWRRQHLRSDVLRPRALATVIESYLAMALNETEVKLEACPPCGVRRYRRRRLVPACKSCGGGSRSRAGIDGPALCVKTP